MMMGGAPPLQYANVDAEFYGLDLAWEYRFGARWLASGNFGYVRGRRSDGADNLYRIAPLSSFAELRYSRERWHISLQSVAAARQDRVSSYNDEQETAGWGIVHLRAGLRLGQRFNLDLGIENVADTVYQDHLGGYNRVRESDIPVGERLYGTGRNLYLRLDATW
jgi:iron complex outermembrane receptor protein